MGDGTRSAFLTFGSLVIVIALTGCSGTSWQFWKTASTAEGPTSSEVASPAPEPTTAEPVLVTSHPPIATARPAPSVETAAFPAPSSNGYVELPGLADVRFRSGQVTVGKADVKTLDGIVRWLKERPGALVMIEGHTDDLGTREQNLTVAEKRAESVMRYLIAKGLEPGRISAISYGSERPVCADKTTTCRAKNRRAHLLVKQP
jgi:peptidoglycan-associated lipoprotein